MAENKKSALSCEEFARLASTRMESGVSLSDRLRMLWHEIRCVYCRRLVAQLKRIRGLLRADAPTAEMPKDMRQQIHQKIRNQP